MEIFDSYILYIERYFNQHLYFPIIFLIEGVIVTYGWSLISKKMEVVILFSTGFMVLSAFFGNIFEKFFAGNVPDIIFLFAGGITGGLLLLGISFVLEIITKVFLFLFGGVLPLILLAHFGFSISTIGSQFFVLILLAILAVSGGVSMLKFSNTQICKIVGSAIGGAITISFILMWSSGLSNYEIFETIGSLDILRNVQNTGQGAFVIIIAITGMLFQSILQIMIKKRNIRIRSASKSPSKELDRVLDK